MTKKNKIKIGIIGAGLSGLFAAYWLAKNNKNIEIIIFEKQSEIGGLLATKNHNNVFFDMGQHIFHSRFPYIKKKIFPILKKQSFHKIKNYAATFFNNQFFDYPMSYRNILQFDEKTATNIIYEISNLNQNQQKENFESAVKSLVGTTLYNIFFKYHTKRHWGIEPKALPSSWVSQRISKFRLNDFTFFGKKEIEFSSKTGTKPLIDFLFFTTKKILKQHFILNTNFNIKSIKKSKNQYIISTKNQQFIVDKLISTIPNDKLLNYFGFKTKKLRFLSTLFVFMQTNQKKFLNFDKKRQKAQSCYFPSKEFFFNRVFEYNLHFNNKIDNSIISVEITLHKNAKQKVDVKKIFSILKKIFNPKAKLIWSTQLVYKNTYPVNLKEMDKLNSNLSKKVKKLGIITIGRMALFKYMNMDETINSTHEILQKEFGD